MTKRLKTRAHLILSLAAAFLFAFGFVPATATAAESGKTLTLDLKVVDDAGNPIDGTNMEVYAYGDGAQLGGALLSNYTEESSENNWTETPGNGVLEGTATVPDGTVDCTIYVWLPDGYAFESYEGNAYEMEGYGWECYYDFEAGEDGNFSYSATWTAVSTSAGDTSAETASEESGEAGIMTIEDEPAENETETVSAEETTAGTTEAEETAAGTTEAEDAAAATTVETADGGGSPAAVAAVAVVAAAAVVGGVVYVKNKKPSGK